MLFPAAVTEPKVGEKLKVVPESEYMVELIVVAWNRLNRLNASAKNSRFIVSVNRKRFDSRRSTLTIFGDRKVFGARPGILVEPPAPSTPVLVNPLIELVVLPEYVDPD